MMMINDASYTMSADFNTSAFVKTIQSISSHDIFTNIVCACQQYGFISNEKVDLLLKNTNNNNKEENDNNENEVKKENKNIKLERQQSLFNDPLLGSQDDFPSLLDTDMLDMDDSDQQSVQSRKTEILAQIDQVKNKNKKLINNPTIYFY